MVITASATFRINTIHAKAYYQAAWSISDLEGREDPQGFFLEQS
jgi:hypothetical protein